MKERIPTCSRCGGYGHYATTCNAKYIFYNREKGQSLGSAVKMARMEQGLSEREAAELAGATVFQLRRLENQPTPPAVLLFIRLVEGATGKKVEDFLRDYRNKNYE